MISRWFLLEVCVVVGLLADLVRMTEFSRYTTPNDTYELSRLLSLDRDSSLRDFFAFRPQQNSLTVILSQYRRTNLKLQVLAMISQTVPITQIYVYQNEEHVDVDRRELEEICKSISTTCPLFKVIQNRGENFKYHGRFSVPLLVDTEYVAIFDDDIIPGDQFLENCLRVVKSFGAICGAAGQILTPLRKVMVFPPTNDDIEVDSVGWAWVFRSEWIKYLWQEEMPTFAQAEDISFGMALWKNGNIRSIVAYQPGEDTNRPTWGAKLSLGDDDVASYKVEGAGMLRWAVCIYWCQQGFIPVSIRATLLSNYALSSYTTFILEILQSNGYLPSPNDMKSWELSPKEYSSIFLVPPRELQQTLLLR